MTGAGWAEGSRKPREPLPGAGLFAQEAAGKPSLKGLARGGYWEL